MAFKPIHQHVIIKAYSSQPIKDEEKGKQFLLDLVSLVNMKPVSKPVSIYISDEGNEGLTGSINLATSHAAYHVWDNTGLLMADLYSCTDFNTNEVIEFFIDKWNLSEVQYSTINRNQFNIYDEHIVITGRHV